MPHIHTEPGQHDFTVSAYIIRIINGEPKLLVHMHKKLRKLMQIGGHIELNETPWQALAHELQEESGYVLSELKILQPQPQPFSIENAVVHPVPLLVNTHKVSDTHYHSDLVYSFVATHTPKMLPANDESADLRWLTLKQLKYEVDHGTALQDVFDIFSAIRSTYLNQYFLVSTSIFSLDEPQLTP